MATYRVDYMPEGQTKEVVEEARTRMDALARARKLSRVHGTAYVIRTVAGKDTGQRVYVRGHYSHTDDLF